MHRPARFLLLTLTLVAASNAGSATISVSASNASRCGVNYGTGFGSYQTYTVCRGAGLFGYGVMYNDTVSTINNSGTAATLEIDSGVLSDTNARPARITLDQELRWNITLNVTADPGEAWWIRMDQSAAGLFALLEEVAGDGNGSLQARFDINQDLNVALGGINYNVDLDPTYLGGTGTKTAGFSGARSDTFSGVGPVVLTGHMRTSLTAYSACLTINPTCSNGPEAAILFGIDDVGGALSVTADDYSTWGRSAIGDGYNLAFTVVPVPAAGWLFVSALGVLGYMGRRSV